MFVDHRQELPHWLLHVHSSVINQSQNPLYLFNAYPAIPAQNFPSEKLNQLVSICLY